MGFIVGFLVAIGIIGAFCCGLYAMYKISEFYNSRIRAAWQVNGRAQSVGTRTPYTARQPQRTAQTQTRDMFMTDAEWDEAQREGKRVSKVIK